MNRFPNRPCFGVPLPTQGYQQTTINRPEITVSQVVNTWTTSWQRLPMLGTAVVFLAAVFCLAWGGLKLSEAHGVAAIWLPDAVVLAVLLRNPRRHWPMYLGLAWLGCFLGNQVQR